MSEMYAMNALTMAVSEYQGLDPIDIVSHENELLLLRADGVFQQQGDDDNGVEIDAHFRGGTLSFGTDKDKKLPRAYLSMVSDQDARLTTYADVRGTQKTHHYKVPSRAMDDRNQERRVRMAGGVEGHRWSFEVANTMGGDLEVRDFRVLPRIIRRRP